MTPTQIARATMRDPRASRYLRLTYATLDRIAATDTVRRHAAVRLLYQNARDGRRVLGGSADNDTLKAAALILYNAWVDTRDTDAMLRITATETE